MTLTSSGGKKMCWTWSSGESFISGQGRARDVFSFSGSTLVRSLVGVLCVCTARSRIVLHMEDCMTVFDL